MRRRTKNQRGTSLAEMMFVLAILGILVGILTKFLSDAQTGLISQENDTDLAAMSANVTNNLTSSVGQCSRLLGNLAVVQPTPGTDSLAGFRTDMNASIATYGGISGVPQPVTWTTIPIQTNLNHVTPEAYTLQGFSATNPDGISSAYVGNALYYIASMTTCHLTGVTNVPLVPTAVPSVGTSPTPTPIPTYTPVPLTLTPMSDVDLDRYQFVALYLTVDSSLFQGLGMPGRLRLVEWRSLPFISYQQISNMTQGSTLLKYTVTALNAMGYTQAFDFSNGDASTAFYTMKATNTPIIAVTGTPPNFAMDSWAYVEEYKTNQDIVGDPLHPKGRVNTFNFSGGVTGRSYYSVAYNNSTVTPASMSVKGLTGNQQGGFQVPWLAAPSSTTPFPAGFEVALVGSGSGQRVVNIRTVFMAVSSGRSANLKTYNANSSQVQVTLINPD